VLEYQKKRYSVAAPTSLIAQLPVVDESPGRTSEAQDEVFDDLLDLGDSAAIVERISADQLAAYQLFHRRLMTIKVGRQTPVAVRLADVLRFAREPDIDYGDILVQLEQLRLKGSSIQRSKRRSPRRLVSLRRHCSPGIVMDSRRPSPRVARCTSAGVMCSTVR